MAKKKRKKAPLADRKRNPNSKYWKGKADGAWRDQIRAVGRCEICPRTTSLNAHHIINRTRLRFRHDLSNGICLCSWHHLRDPDCSPHADSHSDQGFLAWLAENRPGQFQWYEENRYDKREAEWTYESKYEELK